MRREKAHRPRWLRPAAWAAHRKACPARLRVCSVLRRKALPPGISWRGARSSQAQNAFAWGHFHPGPGRSPRAWFAPCWRAAPGSPPNPPSADTAGCAPHTPGHACGARGLCPGGRVAASSSHTGVMACKVRAIAASHSRTWAVSTSSRASACGRAKPMFSPIMPGQRLGDGLGPVHTARRSTARQVDGVPLARHDRTDERQPGGAGALSAHLRPRRASAARPSACAGDGLPDRRATWPDDAQRPATHTLRRQGDAARSGPQVCKDWIPWQSFPLACYSH